MSLQFETINHFPKGYFNQLIEEVFRGNTKLLSLYPNAKQSPDYSTIIAKRKAFSKENRLVLHKVLSGQYSGLDAKTAQKNIDSLLLDNTFTVTTGQQIHIFLGPLYVLYKTLTTIALANKLNHQFRDINVVPVFWMATEDHDFKEIESVEVFNKKYTWQTNQTGAVGKFNLHGLEQIVGELQLLVQNDPHKQSILDIFAHSYTSSNTLAEATRKILHHFFGNQGLIVMDADDIELKKLFIPQIEKDVLENVFEEPVHTQTQKLKNLGLEGIIPARKTNFFLINNQSRSRLDMTEGGFELQSDKIFFSREEMQAKISLETEKFSPNVALRPLYQETILPNLAYIAGPSEMVYWFQIQPIFAMAGLPDPALVARHSFLILNHKTTEQMNSLGIPCASYWQSEEMLKNILLESMNVSFDISKNIEVIDNQINEILKLFFEAKFPALRAVKKEAENFSKNLRKQQQQLKDYMTDSELVGQKWNKMIKWKQTFFNLDAPQERKVTFLEILLQNPTILEEFAHLPEAIKTPLVIGYQTIN